MAFPCAASALIALVANWAQRSRRAQPVPTAKQVQVQPPLKERYPPLEEPRRAELTKALHELARTLEPRTATPQAKLKAIRELAAIGVPVRAMVAPVIPGLTDSEIPAILRAAKEAGALGASFVMLRLPYAVAPIFSQWLRTHRPLAAERVESLLRSMRGGKLYRAEWGTRMRGTGPYAEGIAASFAVFKKKLGLDQDWPDLDTSQFRPPQLPGGLRRLLRGVLGKGRAVLDDIGNLGEG